MIQQAGIGIAMDKAVSELKQAADLVTRSCDEEGIAYALVHDLMGSWGKEDKIAWDRLFFCYA